MANTQSAIQFGLSLRGLPLKAGPLFVCHSALVHASAHHYLLRIAYCVVPELAALDPALRQAQEPPVEGRQAVPELVEGQGPGLRMGYSVLHVGYCVMRKI